MRGPEGWHCSDCERSDWSAAGSWPAIARLPLVRRSGSVRPSLCVGNGVPIWAQPEERRVIDQFGEGEALDPALAWCRGGESVSELMRAS
jgi:hypothetical protein